MQWLKHRNILRRSLNIGTSELKTITTLVKDAPTLFFCIDICMFVSPLALLTTKAWYHMGNNDRLDLFLVCLFSGTSLRVFLLNFARWEKRWAIKSHHF